MADRILTIRELNRAVLERQMLLERVSKPVPTVIEKLVGMQAQLSSAPFVGLWTRINGFERGDLARLIEVHTVVKATMMRATLHLLTADDYVLLRGALIPVLAAASGQIVKQREAEFDTGKILAAALAFIDEKPRSFAEISEMLTALMPGVDVGAMRYTVRTHLPLVQVPTKTAWSYPGNPQFTLAETWLGKAIPEDDHFKTLIFRYLAAFGPASITDMQTWSGLGKLKEAVEKLRPELVTYRDENKRELFDLPELPIPDADTPAPERFLPEFDNLLLSHDKRTRVVADAHRKGVYLPGLRVAATILVDGFVRGAWKVEAKKGEAALTITPFEPLTKGNIAALTEEGERLVRFVEPDAKAYAVRVGE